MAWKHMACHFQYYPHAPRATVKEKQEKTFVTQSKNSDEREKEGKREQEPKHLHSKPTNHL